MMTSTTFTILWTSLLGLLLAGYLAQQYLPPPTPKLVGIDLGTTYSCIGVYEAVTGRITIIPTKDGRLTIPSIVHFGQNEISTGYEALNKAKTDPRNTIYDAKRLIGKQFTSEEIERMSDHYPFRINLDDGLMAKLMIGTRDNQTMVTPEFVGSRIIEVLKTAAETNLGVSVTKAVMAVPIEFDEMQRNFTKYAAKLAGLDVLRIINEPTAAALAYGLHKKENVDNVMVVDLGGGTSDVSILNVQHGMFLTRSIAGNNYLGGQDFNRRLFDHLLSFVEKETGSKLKDAEEIHAFQQVIEEAKLNLTNVDVVRLTIPFRSLDYVLNYDLTRDTFEKVNSDLFAKVVQLLDTVLNESELRPEDIDEIVLVGGSTRIPKVRQIITEYFGKLPNTNLDPELAVGHGVALQAGIIGGMWPLQVSAIEIPTKLRKIHLK